MDFAPLIAMAALVVAVVNFLKFVRVKDWNGAATQAIVWVAGIFTVLLVARSDFGGGIRIGDNVMADLNGFSLVFIGMTIASTGSLAVELKKAFDNTDSAAKPNLVSDKKE